MNRTELRRRLIGISIEDRVPIIEEFLEELPKEEFEKYRKLRGISANALKKYRGVTKAKSELQNKGQLDFCGQMHYSLIHQVARVADGQEPITPSMEMKNNGVKTRQTLRKNCQGKSISKLMSMSKNVSYSRRPSRTKYSDD